MAHIGHPLVADALYASGYATKSRRLPDNLRSIVDRVRPAIEPLTMTELARDPVALRRQCVRANVRAGANHLRHGSPVLERIFNLPGMASHFIEAALQRDYPLAMGMVVVYTIILLVMNALVDASYSLIDPRIKVE